MWRRVGVKPVGKRMGVGVGLGVVPASFEVVKVGVGAVPASDDATQLLADHGQGELDGHPLGGVARGVQPDRTLGEGVEVEGGRSGRVFVDRAVGRRGDEQWVVG